MTKRGSDVSGTTKMIIKWKGDKVTIFCHYHIRLCQMNTRFWQIQDIVVRTYLFLGCNLTNNKVKTTFNGNI